MRVDSQMAEDGVEPPCGKLVWNMDYTPNYPHLPPAIKQVLMCGTSVREQCLENRRGSQGSDKRRRCEIDILTLSVLRCSSQFSFDLKLKFAPAICIFKTNEKFTYFWNSDFFKLIENDLRDIFSASLYYIILKTVFVVETIRYGYDLNKTRVILNLHLHFRRRIEIATNNEKLCVNHIIIESYFRFLFLL